jgi:hypothetical protein
MVGELEKSKPIVVSPNVSLVLARALLAQAKVHRPGMAVR